MDLARRSLRSFFGLLFLVAAAVTGCAGTATREPHPPVVFVHGNGDTAANWIPTLWRFESNGWPRERLFAPDLSYPLARDEDDKPLEARSSAADNMKALADEVARVRRLTGAENVVLPGLDHREVSYHPIAFVQTYRFITGAFPARWDIVPEDDTVLDGRITGHLGASITNLPLPGASIEVFEVSAQTGERLGGAAHARKVGADGQWGPFRARRGASYEFVVRAPGYAIAHYYRMPFPRSSGLVHFRPARIVDADRDAAAVVTMYRPRGYFGAGRDRMSLDGKPLPGIPPGVPGVAASKLKLNDAAPRSIVAEFNGQRVVARSWPLKDDHVVFAEIQD